MAAPAASKPDRCYYCGALPVKRYFLTTTKKDKNITAHYWTCGECFLKGVHK